MSNLSFKVMGIDAGLQDTPTSVAVIDADGNTIYDCFYTESIREILDKVQTMCSRIQPQLIWVVDNSMGVIVVGALKGLPVIPVTITRSNKAEMQQSFRQAIEDGKIKVSKTHRDDLAFEVAFYGLNHIGGE